MTFKVGDVIVYKNDSGYITKRVIVSQDDKNYHIRFNDEAKLTIVDKDFTNLWYRKLTKLEQALK